MVELTWIRLPVIEPGYQGEIYSGIFVPSCEIAKYPVTNLQFKKFIEAGGYHDSSWWTDAGWERRLDAGWTMPEFWTDTRFNGYKQPVVGVSWYEAIAYCQWFSYITNNKISLPISLQWEQAANKFGFPKNGEFNATKYNNNLAGVVWGNEFSTTVDEILEWKLEDLGVKKNEVLIDVLQSYKRGIFGVGAQTLKINIKLKNVPAGHGERTTDVDAYEDFLGNDPFTVVDMNGNTFEWCMDYLNSRAAYTNLSHETFEIEGTKLREARGGSWRIPGNIMLENDPHLRNDDLGFRLVRLP